MLNLLKNEYSKIFRKVSTYVILAICLLLSIGISLLIQYENNYYDEYYYKEMSFQQELDYYEKSEYAYDKLCAVEYKTYIEMGYDNYTSMPAWISDAVWDTVFKHYAYVLLAESEDRENMELELGISLDGVDTDYEKSMYEAKVGCIKSGDYKGYSQKCLDYIDYLKKNNEEFVADENEYKGEYHKYIVEKDINPEVDEAKLSLFQIYASAKGEYENMLEQKKQGQNVSEYLIEKQREVYEIYKYILDNDVENYMTDELELDRYVQPNKFMTALTSNTMVASMAGIFVMIIAAGIVANEFSNGTIKFLLINPVKRAKIFWSKYMTCISLLIGALAAFFVIHLLFCIIICGTDGLGGVYISYSEGIVSEQSIILYSFEQYLLSGLSILVSVTLAFTISSLMRNNAVAIAISVAIELLGATITLFLCELGHDWARYLVFANTDLASISKGQTMFPGQTVQFSLTVIAVYMAIFLLMAYDGFKKKEV